MNRGRTLDVRPSPQHIKCSDESLKTVSRKVLRTRGRSRIATKGELSEPRSAFNQTKNTVLYCAFCYGEADGR